MGTGNDIVTIGFGSPRKYQTVILDTGSDVSWIQCKPCSVSCYQQQDPLFDPSSSSTYHKISCSSPICRHLAIKGCSGGKCVHALRYTDNSTTVGFLAQDTLTLMPEYVFKNFVFGCDQLNQGLFGTVAELIGLGRDPISLVSRTAMDLGGSFYYRLPSVSSSTGYLTIGGSSSMATNPSYTSMLHDSHAPSSYIVSLMSISVGGQLLPISQTVFQTAGSIIDSGTDITRLPPSAYAALRSAFRSALSPYPMAQRFNSLDTCYDFSSVEHVCFPTVALHFEGGANLILPVSGTFVASISQVCLAFSGNASPTNLGIIGNTQQKTVEVIYDLGANRISFAAGACS